MADWQRRTHGKDADQAVAELDALVQMGVAEWREVPSTAGRVRRVLRLVNSGPANPYEIEQMQHWLSRKRGQASVRDWQRRTKGKTADAAFNELNALVQAGLARWEVVKGRGRPSWRIVRVGPAAAQPAAAS